MNERVEISVEVTSAEEAEELRQLVAEEDGVEAETVAGLGPLAAIILVGGIFTLACVILKWIKEGKKKYGLLIDLRPESTDPIVRDPDLEYGQIVIISPTEDGKSIKVSVENYDPDNDFTAIGKKIFETLSAGVAKTFEAIKDAVETVVGDGAEVKAEVLPAGA